MERKEENNQTDTEGHEGSLDGDWEECHELGQLPALEPLQPFFPFLCAEILDSVLSPPTVKLLEPTLDEHGQECIDEDECEAEEKQQVDDYCVRGGRGGSELSRIICGSGRVAELLRNVDEYVHCDVSAVRFEFGDCEDKEGGKKGSK